MKMKNRIIVTRLDNYLVEKKFTDSRNKAQALIKKGLARINEKVILKSSFKVENADEVRVEKHDDYVSRSAHKLKFFLQDITLDP